MRKHVFMWAAAALTLLAGCQKPDYSGKEIRFTVTSAPDPETKTAYSGEMSGTKERINWVEGDRVTIYSDAASNAAGYKVATYSVSGITNSGAFSTGKIGVVSKDGGLQWGSGTHHFYGIYPGNPVEMDAIPMPITSPLGTSAHPFSSLVFPATINSAPDMAKAYMLAYSEREEADAAAPLDFTPAFTAFYVEAGTDTEMYISSIVLKSGSTALSGTANAYHDGSNWVFTNPTYIDGTNNSITYDYTGSPLILSPGEANKLTWGFFALPQDLTQVTIIFNVSTTVGGTPTPRSLKLKTASDYAGGTINRQTYGANEWLIFDACKKTRISGLLIPGSTWTVNDTTPVVLRESVAPWDDNTQNHTYGPDDLVVNASGLDEVNLSTHSYRFSIYEPEGKTWKIKVLNSSGAVVPGVKITRVNHPGTTDPADGYGELNGTIRKGLATAPGLIEFSLSSDTGCANCTLSFSVIADEKEYSINSEVVRGTWGTDYGYINL